MGLFSNAPVLLFGVRNARAISSLESVVTKKCCHSSLLVRQLPYPSVMHLLHWSIVPLLKKCPSPKNPENYWKTLHAVVRVFYRDEFFVMARVIKCIHQVSVAYVWVTTTVRILSQIYCGGSLFEWWVVDLPISSVPADQLVNGTSSCGFPKMEFP
jgi:hypothetical protein